MPRNLAPTEHMISYQQHPILTLFIKICASDFSSSLPSLLSRYSSAWACLTGRFFNTASALPSDVGTEEVLKDVLSLVTISSCSIVVDPTDAFRTLSKPRTAAKRTTPVLLPKTSNENDGTRRGANDDASEWNRVNKRMDWSFTIAVLVSSILAVYVMAMKQFDVG